MTVDGLLDANVLIRFLTKDDPVKAERVLRLFQKALSDSVLYEVPSIVFAELVWVLDSYYEWPRVDIAERLASLLGMPPFHFPERELLARSLELYKTLNVDFIDAFLAASILEAPSKRIYSFDRDFDRIPGVIRTEP